MFYVNLVLNSTGGKSTVNAITVNAAGKKKPKHSKYIN